MENFWVIVKSQDTNDIVEEFGAMSESKAVKLADKIDEESNGDVYAEVIEK